MPCEDRLPFLQCVPPLSGSAAGHGVRAGVGSPRESGADKTNDDGKFLCAHLGLLVG